MGPAPAALRRGPVPAGQAAERHDRFSGPVLGVLDGGGPEEIPHADACGDRLGIIDHFGPEDPPRVVEVPHGQELAIEEPPVVARYREDQILVQLVAR